MPERNDYYELLCLPRDASPEDIRQTYFEAARRLHPDTNVAPGDTEFFLDVQEAYEVLSDPKKRAKYDATLPPKKTALDPVSQRVLFSRTNLLRQDEPQLVYVLLEFSPQTSSQSTAPPLNLCLVIDRSTSMQGRNMDIVKSTAIQLLRRLRPQDRFSVVVFSDRAEVIIPAARDTDMSKLEARIQMLQTSGGTEIFQGLEMGYYEVQRSLNQPLVSHIILLTDGRTYGDEEKCLELAEKAAKQGIGISGLGIGYEWNDAFLDEVAVRTGGSSIYLAKPQDIQRLLLEKFDQLWQVYAEETKLEFKLPKNIELSYTFRLQPEAGPLSLESPMLLGPITRENSLKVLMEFVIQPAASKKEVVTLLDGKLIVSIFGQKAPVEPLSIRLVRPTSDSATLEPPPHEIVEALSRLTLYRLQEQACLEVTAGAYDRANEHLQCLATHLLAQGERGLARTVLMEAENIQRQRSISKEGGKQIKYGTRALLTSGKETKS